MRRVALVALMYLMAASGWAADRPLPVSPGDVGETFAVVEAACPTFSWDPVRSATAHELVVYRVDEASRPEAEPMVRVTLPGAAGSWTPALGQCLERGQSYAWSVRAIGRRAEGRWSEATLFRVASGPTIAEVEEALAVLRSFMESTATGGAAVVELPSGYRSALAPPFAAFEPTPLSPMQRALTVPSFTVGGLFAQVLEDPVIGDAAQQDLVAVQGISAGQNYYWPGGTYRVGVYGEALEGTWPEGKEYGVLGIASGGTGVAGDGETGGYFSGSSRAIQAVGEVYVYGGVHATKLYAPLKLPWPPGDPWWTSGANQNPEVYEITDTDPALPPCNESSRGSLAIMRPSMQSTQDSLCYCAKIDFPDAQPPDPKYSWWCFNM